MSAHINTEKTGPRFVVSLDGIVLAETGKLTRIPVAVVGSWVKGGDKITFTLADLQAIARNFAKLGTDGREKNEIVVDYEHAAEFHDPRVSKDGYDAAGWIKGIEAPKAGDRFLYADVELTDDARARIGDKKIKFVSPVIYPHWTDKRTGKDQGPTLTSLALTNRPFLEELPAIALSDRAYQLVDLDQVHVPGKTNAPARGGKENPMKKVKVSAIKSGDKAGHLKISHPDLPDDSDFYADADDAGDALDSASKVDKEGGKALGEATGLRGKTLSEQIPEVRKRFEQKVIALSEIPAKAEGPDKGAPDFSAFAPAAGTLVAAEVFTAQQKELVLSDAVAKKQILPKEKVHLRKLALSDLRDYLADKPGVSVDTGVRGLSDGGQGSEGKGTAFSELDAAIKKVIADKRASGYGEAMKIVAAEQPELRARYDKEHLARPQDGDEGTN